MFQVALVFGAPWGELTLGGKYRGKLPYIARVIAVISSLILAGCAVIVLARANIAFGFMRSSSDWLVWCVVAYMAIAVVMNFATPSSRERKVWLPVAMGMLVSSTLVGFM